MYQTITCILNNTLIRVTHVAITLLYYCSKIAVRFLATKQMEQINTILSLGKTRQNSPKLCQLSQWCMMWYIWHLDLFHFSNLVDLLCTIILPLFKDCIVRPLEGERKKKKTSRHLRLLQFNNLPPHIVVKGSTTLCVGYRDIYMSPSPWPPIKVFLCRYQTFSFYCILIQAWKFDAIYVK